MINALSELKLGRARNVKSWTEVLRLYQPRDWINVPVDGGRMAFTVVEGHRVTGRMLALVMMENCRAPEVAFPSGSLFLGIHGELMVMESHEERVMDTWDIVHFAGMRQAPRAQGLYLGLWAFPIGNILLRMAEINRVHT